MFIKSNVYNPISYLMPMYNINMIERTFYVLRHAYTNILNINAHSVPYIHSCRLFAIYGSNINTFYVYNLPIQYTLPIYIHHIDVYGSIYRPTFKCTTYICII